MWQTYPPKIQFKPSWFKPLIGADYKTFQLWTWLEATKSLGLPISEEADKWYKHTSTSTPYQERNIFETHCPEGAYIEKAGSAVFIITYLPGLKSPIRAYKAPRNHPYRYSENPNYQESLNGREREIERDKLLKNIVDREVNKSNLKTKIIIWFEFRDVPSKQKI